MEEYIQSIADAMHERWLARDEPSRLRAAYQEIDRAESGHRRLRGHQWLEQGAQHLRSRRPGSWYSGGMEERHRPRPARPPARVSDQAPLRLHGRSTLSACGRPGSVARSPRGARPRPPRSTGPARQHSQSRRHAVPRGHQAWRRGAVAPGPGRPPGRSRDRQAPLGALVPSAHAPEAVHRRRRVAPKRRGSARRRPKAAIPAGVDQAWPVALQLRSERIPSWGPAPDVGSFDAPCWMPSPRLRAASLKAPGVRPSSFTAS